MPHHNLSRDRRDGAEPKVTANVVRAVALRYSAGADPALDRPAHVRSASALAWIDGALVVVQDDANFLALADPATGLCNAITLPAGEDGLRQFDDVRGNKRHKLDLEACTVIPDPRGGELLLAFGSGSLAARESVVLVRGVTARVPEVRVVRLPAMYAMLRGVAAFAGSELNLEGVAYVDGRVALANRGNGAPERGASRRTRSRGWTRRRCWPTSRRPTRRSRPRCATWWATIRGGWATRA